MKLITTLITILALCAFSFAQSAAYSFAAKRFDPIVTADVYPLRGTPLGDLQGIAFAGYRKDGDNGLDVAPLGLGAVKRFPFGENLSFQAGLHVITAKGSPVDWGVLIGFSYTPTPTSAFSFGPTARGLRAEYRLRF